MLGADERDMTMLRLNIALGLVLALGLGVAAVWTVPPAIDAGRTLAARNDPAQLSDLAIERGFDAATAEREIRAALAANDPELAQSFIELARERMVAVDPTLVARADADMEAWSSFGGSAWRFARGFFAGYPDDVASLAGTAAGDLLVIGDIRDAARESWHLARGEESNRLVLGLSLGGLAVTAGTFASFGLAAPARAGLSVVKAAGKSERIGARFLRLLRWEKPAALVEVAGDVGRIEAKAGGRAAFEAVQLAQDPKDLAAFGRLAVAKGGKTRAILKFLGRGAIAITGSIIDLALALMWAVANVLGFFASMKRAAERATLALIRRRKARRARLAVGAALAPAA
jgi:hypothetical protein